MAMLESDSDINVVGEAGNGNEALASAKALHPDILLLDIRMPEMKTGLEAAAKLRNYSPATKAVILSMPRLRRVCVEALNAGAYGYLLKDTDKSEFIKKRSKQIHAGNKYFSGAVSNVLAKLLKTQTAQQAGPRSKKKGDPAPNSILNQKKKRGGKKKGEDFF